MAGNIDIGDEESLVDLFTSNDQLENLTPKDALTEVVGYVDEVHNPRSVAQDRYRLFKFILNNSHGKRIQILIWGDLIEQYQNQVQLRAVVHIESAFCKSCTLTFMQQQQRLVPFELNLQSHSRLNILGHYTDDMEGSLGAINEVDFNTISNFHTHAVRIRGYLKIAFRIIITRGARSIIAAITNGHSKVPIVLNNFNDDILASLQAIPRRSMVTVTGRTCYDSNGIISINCTNSQNIEQHPQAPLLSLQEIFRGNANVIANNVLLQEGVRVVHNGVPPPLPINIVGQVPPAAAEVGVNNGQLPAGGQGAIGLHQGPGANQLPGQGGI